MSYTTTSVSRRLVAAKGKPVQRPKPPADKRGEHADFSSGKASVPELFSRSSSRLRPVATPTPWWTTWLVVTLTNVAVVAVLIGIYTLSQRSASDNERSVEPRHTLAARPAAVNIRPMGLSSSRHSTLSTAGRSAAGGFAVSGDLSTVESLPLDGSSKLVLPPNVSGNCDIGDSGRQDFGRCLAKNGARAE